MIKANIAWSAKQIAKAVTKGSMVFDNAIQRGNVWNVVQQSLLIESLIHNYPVPPMYTIKQILMLRQAARKAARCSTASMASSDAKRFEHSITTNLP